MKIESLEVYKIGRFTEQTTATAYRLGLARAVRRPETVSRVRLRCDEPGAVALDEAFQRRQIVCEPGEAVRVHGRPDGALRRIR